MPGEIETAHNFPRNILRGILSPMFGGVERNDANRLAVLAGHQVADGGFEVGFADIGFRKCGAQVSKVVDDEIKIPIVAVRHNRRKTARAHKKLQTHGYRKNLSMKSGRRNRSPLPPTTLAMISGERFGAGFGAGACAMSTSVIATTRTMAEIARSNRTCGVYVKIDANDPKATIRLINQLTIRPPIRLAMT